MVSKYDSLALYLMESGQRVLRMTFQEVEAIVGDLPPAAWEHRAWWSNNDSHTSARNGWLAGGYKTSKVDMENQTLLFVRADPITSFRPRWNATTLSGPMTQRLRQSISGDAVLMEVIRSAGGVENLHDVVEAIEKYIKGDILENELGRLLRKIWPRY